MCRMNFEDKQNSKKIADHGVNNHYYCEIKWSSRRYVFNG